MVAFAALDDVKAKFGALGSEILVSDETATRAWIAQERERWGKVVRSANLKAN